MIWKLLLSYIGVIYRDIGNKVETTTIDDGLSAKADATLT